MKIVNSVTDQERGFVGNRFELELDAILAGISVKIGVDGIEISLNEFCQQVIKVNDVLVGPFDL